MDLVPTPVNKTASQNCKEYIWTDPTSWTVLKDGKAGRTIESIPYTGESEEFSAKITTEELTGVKDDNGDIWFSKVMEFFSLLDRDILDNGATGPARPPINFWE